MRARQWPVWLLLVITGGPFFIAAVLDPSDKRVGWFLLFVVALCLVFLFVNARHYIYLDNDVLIHKTVISKREIRWNEIVRSEISWAVEGTHSASLNWSFQTSSKQLEIRLGFFSRADMQLLAQQLMAQAPQAVLSKKVYQFAEGKFPWFLF